MDRLYEPILSGVGQIAHGQVRLSRRFGVRLIHNDIERYLKMLGLLMSRESFFQTDMESMLRSLIEMYPDAEESQITAWRTLLSDITNSHAAQTLPANCLFGIEFSLPTDGMAIDFLVAGRDQQGTPVVCIVEAKQWNDHFIRTTQFSCHRSAEAQLHPQIQVSRHKLSFSGYLDIGSIFEVIPFVYVRNCSAHGLQELADKNIDPVSRRIEMYHNIDDVFTAVSRHVFCEYPAAIDLFLNSEYTPSRGIIDAMNSIVTREEPFILTPEQEIVTSQIRDSIANGNKVIRIMGAAGTGKTAVLLNLYVQLLNDMGRTGIKPIFVSGAQNTAYYQSKFPDVRNSFTYSFSLDRMIRPRNAHRKIILMDEAQHNRPGIISEMVRRGATLVLCYDAAQVINANNALDELNELEERPDFVSLELNHTVRFNGSQVAERNINACLDGETVFLPDQRFVFQLFHSFADFQNRILSVMNQHPEATVAVTGLLSSDANDFTTGNGNIDSLLFTDWSNPNNWEKPECRWMPYVLGRNYLNQNDGKIWVGTWWMPGLDVDYVFVIVGGDAKMTRNGLVAVPEKTKLFSMMASVAGEFDFPDDVYSNRTSVTARRICEFIRKPENEELKRCFLQRFSELLRNNYYIMMSRGRKGCFIFFTDYENSE